MDYFLGFSQPMMEITPAEQKGRILAAGADGRARWHLTLTPDDAEMLMQTERSALRAEGEVRVGAGIVPRLIRWFTPAGLVGSDYPLMLSQLTEAFFRIKGEISENGGEQMDEARTNTVVPISDNALLDLMFHFYICPECEGDIDGMAELLSAIVVPAVRLAVKKTERRNVRRAKPAPLSDAEMMRLLCADQLQAARSMDDWEPPENDDWRRHMCRWQVCGQEQDYYEMARQLVRPYFDRASGRTVEFLENIAGVLDWRPELVLPSPDTEDMLSSMVAVWEAEDGKESGDEQ